MLSNILSHAASCLCQIVILGVLAKESLAQTAALDHSPDQVINRYLSLDYKGARLDPLSVETVASYISWQEEPTWDQVVVLRGFMVEKQYRQWERIDSFEVIIPVTFQVLGVVHMDTAEFVEEVGTKEVRFRVKAFKGRWKIVSPMLPPHVGQKRIVSLTREAEINEKDQTKKDRLKILQSELRKMK